MDVQMLQEPPELTMCILGQSLHTRPRRLANLTF
eukprot:CAMPEP_0183395922 /NCGR_PEP_ID=MMETSP0370-20130417/9675_1 /TAXON_ID=268820 /ORGANISM="Peridinium aciculiferum, Strain PAER-2" /LENGTH=33 /DNA_ID= /DNA_START= /DNA_END= /DNA_ORIENTATION=